MTWDSELFQALQSGFQGNLGKFTSPYCIFDFMHSYEKQRDKGNNPYFIDGKWHAKFPS